MNSLGGMVLARFKHVRGHYSLQTTANVSTTLNVEKNSF